MELTLSVVGIDFPNADGSNRLSEAMMTPPGAPIELVPEPKNKRDPNAIEVFSPQGVQIGYVNAERAPYVGLRMGRGEDVAAILQGIYGSSAFVRTSGVREHPHRVGDILVYRCVGRLPCSFNS